MYRNDTNINSNAKKFSTQLQIMKTKTKKVQLSSGYRIPNTLAELIIFKLNQVICTKSTQFSINFSKRFINVSFEIRLYQIKNLTFLFLISFVLSVKTVFLSHLKKCEWVLSGMEIRSIQGHHLQILTVPINIFW